MAGRQSRSSTGPPYSASWWLAFLLGRGRRPQRTSSPCRENLEASTTSTRLGAKDLDEQHAASSEDLACRDRLSTIHIEASWIQRSRSPRTSDDYGVVDEGEREYWKPSVPRASPLLLWSPIESS